MSRLGLFALVAAAAFASAGCKKDVCADLGGACVALHLESASPGLTDVDQLTIDGAGFVQVDPLRTPTVPKRVSLPIDVAVGFHDGAAGNETIHVLAFLGGSAVGDGSANVDIVAGKHLAVDVRLESIVGGSDDDMATGDDGGEADLGSVDMTPSVPKHKGDPCTPSDTCDTGHCVDGVCCDSDCAGACLACTVSGLVGTCSTIPAGGTPVHGMCVTQPASTCGTNGTCDGNGACAKYPQGTTCGASSCDSGTNKFTPASKCDGAGTCQTLAMQDCAPYKCKDATQCFGPPCADSTQCSGSNTCVNMSCGLLGSGRNCTADAQCSSTHCVDGVCCNSACNGQCQACDIPDSMSNLGTCQTVMTGAPHGTRTPCTGTGMTCGGSCQGTPTACTYPTTTVKCNSSCKSMSTETDFFCNGAGTCPSAGTDTVCAGGFACSGTSCLTSCSTNMMCQSGYVCAAPSCTTCGNGMKDGSETDVDCGGSCPVKCAINKTCSVAGDCANGNCVGGFCTPVSNLPKWLSIAAMPTVRTELAAGSYSPTQIYILGSLTGTHMPPGDVLIYTIPSNSYSIDANGSSIVGSGVAGNGSGSVFQFGGHDTDMFFETDEVSLFPGNVGKASLLTARAYLAALFDPLDGHYYAVGGGPLNSTQPCFAVNEIYTVSTNTWTNGVAMAHTRCGLGLAFDKSTGRMYAMGGEAHFAMHDNVTSIESWKPGDAAWTQITAAMPRPRSYVGGTIGADGRAWVIGGEDAAVSGDTYVDAYNPVTNHWDSVAQLGGARTRAAAVLGGDGRIYVFGGEQSGTQLASAEAYGPTFTLSPTHTKAGMTVSVSGSNFAASANVAINFINGASTTLLKTGTSSAAGVMAATAVTIPSVPAGSSYVIQCVDNRSGYPVTSPFTVDP